MCWFYLWLVGLLQRHTSETDLDWSYLLTHASTDTDSAANYWILTYSKGWACMTKLVSFNLCQFLKAYSE